MWWAILAAALGCYVAKYAGLSVPERVLEGVRMQRVASLLPVVLLTTLVIIQTFSVKQQLAFDARAGGLVVAIIAQRLRAPFLVVVIVATVATALIRHFV